MVRSREQELQVHAYVGVRSGSHISVWCWKIRTVRDEQSVCFCARVRNFGEPIGRNCELPDSHKLSKDMSDRLLDAVRITTFIT